MRKDSSRHLPGAKQLENQTRYFTDQEMVKICQAIGASAEQRGTLRKDLVGAAVFYEMHKSMLDARASEIRHEYTQVGKSIAAAAEQLQRMSERARLTARMAAGDIAERYGEDWFGPLELHEKRDCERDLRERAFISFACDIRGVCRLEEIFLTLAERLVRDRGGRPRDEALDRYIIDLADVYTDTTSQHPLFKLTYDRGTSRYWSPFLDFVEMNLKIVQYGKKLSNASLATIVRRALRESGRYSRREARTCRSPDRQP
jgi:hypothetical protein